MFCGRQCACADADCRRVVRWAGGSSRNVASTRCDPTLMVTTICIQTHMGAFTLSVALLRSLFLGARSYDDELLCPDTEQLWKARSASKPWSIFMSTGHQTTLPSVAMCRAKTHMLALQDGATADPCEQDCLDVLRPSPLHIAPPRSSLLHGLRAEQPRWTLLTTLDLIFLAAKSTRLSFRNRLDTTWPP